MDWMAAEGTANRTDMASIVPDSSDGVAFEDEGAVDSATCIPRFV